MKDWNDKSVIMNFKRTNNRTESAIDIYYTHEGSDKEYNGFTRFRKNGNYINPDKSNWEYARIYYNLDNGMQPSIDAKEHKRLVAVFKHEVGHALGLNENNTNQNTIMCQAGFGRKVTDVQECERNGIYQLYMMFK